MTDTKPTPYAWTVTGTAQMFFGDYAQHDAEDVAKCCGGTARAFPLFAEPTVAQLQGWKAVPVEPTENMRATFEAQQGTSTFFTNTTTRIGDFGERYRAMVQAAPAMPARQPLTDADQWDAKLGRTAMRFVDRAGDVHPGIDDAEKICADFHAAMSSVIDEMPWVKRMHRMEPPTASE